MALNWNIYDQWRKSRIDPASAAISGTLKCAFVTSAYTPDQNLHDFWDDVSANQVSGTNYTAGGNALTGVSITVSGAGLVTFDANDPAQWAQSASGFSNGRRAILYWDTGVAATSRLFCYSDANATDFGNVAGPLDLQLDAAGIVTSAR